MTDYISYLIFFVGILASFFVGGNNVAPAVGVMVSTNVLRKRTSYLLNSISLFIGVTFGGITMLRSVNDLIVGNEIFKEITIFSVLIGSTVAFFFLNKAGIPSSLSQMIYPSLFVMYLLQYKYIDFDVSSFYITIISWIVSPLISIMISLAMYRTLSILINPSERLLNTLRIYKFLIILSSVFVSFVTGANAIGIIASAGILAFPSYIVLPLYAVSSVGGLFLSSKRTMLVVGFRITKLGYVAGSAAMIGSSAISEVFTIFGVPISITQTLLGGIIGLSFRSLTSDIRKQLRQLAKGWVTSPMVSLGISISILGFLRIILGL